MPQLCWLGLSCKCEGLRKPGLATSFTKLHDGSSLYLSLQLPRAALLQRMWHMWEIWRDKNMLNKPSSPYSSHSPVLKRQTPLNVNKSSRLWLFSSSFGCLLACLFVCCLGSVGLCHAPSRTSHTAGKRFRTTEDLGEICHEVGRCSVQNVQNAARQVFMGFSLGRGAVGGGAFRV